MKRHEVEAWLRAREPARPEALAERMARALDACPAAALDGSPTMAGSLGMLGLRSLSAVEAGTADATACAMELLAADAFVTYAFEAAAEEGVSVAPLVAWLVREAA